MFKLAYSVTVVGALVFAGGCGGGSGSKTADMSVPAGSDDDMAVQKTYAPATPNQVDTNVIGGNFGVGTLVSMSNVIVLGEPQSFKAKSGTQCKFEAWVQDTACTTPPCGLVIVTPAIPFPPGATYCPYAYQTANLLQNVGQGDVLDITGEVDGYAQAGMEDDMTPTGNVDQHEIDLDSATVKETKQTLPTPIPVTDTNPSMFVGYSGMGWAKYEGTYVQLTPMGGGKFTTVAAPFEDVTLSPGGALVGHTFAYAFRPDGASIDFPPAGLQYSSVSGVASLVYGGNILPLQSSDLAP